ncbi:MAG: hypothetical protein HRU19_15710 [Pseudobacteriovorax sp.]|nr:hypothetical protein [Pseudobacteriovorax sp.]
MNIRCSEDEKSFIEFIPSDFLEANGSRSYEFTIDASSYGFSAKCSKIWLEESEIVKFINHSKNIFHSGKGSSPLSAISEFEMSLVAVDQVGHLAFIASFMDLVSKNQAIIHVPVNTQKAIDFCTELNRLINLD